MNSKILCCVFTIAVALSVSQAMAADTLMDKLKEAGWDGVIGNGVDDATEGKTNTTTYAWKIKDRVIEITTKSPTNETVALMCVNAQNGQVVQMGADKQGASSLGEWKVEADGTAVLNLVFTGGDAAQGAVPIRHKLVDKDKMKVAIQLAEPRKRHGPRSFDLTVQTASGRSTLS